MHPKERMHAQACTEELWKEKSNPKIVRRGPMCAGAHVHTHNTHTHTKRQLEVHPKGKSMMSSSSLPTSLTRFSHPLLAHLSPPSHHLLLVHLPPYQHIQGFQDRKKKCKKEKKAPTLALHQLLVSLCHKDRVKHLPDLSLNPGPWKPPPLTLCHPTMGIGYWDNLQSETERKWIKYRNDLQSDRHPRELNQIQNLSAIRHAQENWIKFKHYLQSDTQREFHQIQTLSAIIHSRWNWVKYQHYLQSDTSRPLGIQSYQQSDAQEFESEIICNQTSQGTGIELNSTLSAITQKPENSKEPVTLFSSQNSVTRIYTDFLNAQNSLLSLDWKRWWWVKPSRH